MKKLSFGEAVELMREGKLVSEKSFARGESSPIEYKYIYLCPIYKQFRKVIKAKDEEKAKMHDYTPASCEILSNEWYLWKE